MTHRKTVPVNDSYEIALATENMQDGRWAVVSTVKQKTDTAQRIVDLPVTDQRFGSEAEAEDYGVRMATEWIDRNTPQAADPQAADR
ncbi:MAG: hypothetical protein ACREKQ_16040 [Candidatus Rokuibacteriota bacterium]